MEHDIVCNEKDIQDRVWSIGFQISHDFDPTHSKIRKQPPILIGILNGSFIFYADLLRQITVDCEVDFMKVKSYVNNQQTELTLEKDVSLNIEGRDIIIVEDIVDSGKTIDFLLEHLKKKNPKSIRIAALLVSESYDDRQQIRYIGFGVPKDVFVYGYGLDSKGLYRNLKFIAKI